MEDGWLGGSASLRPGGTGARGVCRRLHYVPAIIPWLLYPSLDVLNAIAGVALLGSFVPPCVETARHT